MKKNKLALNFSVLALIVTSFIACDSDFNNLESDVLNSGVATNFDILNSNYDVITYTNALGPVQTNNGIGLSTLGLYDDAYGRVTSSFVSQVSLSSYDPTFLGSANELQIDSVVLTLPYFSGVTDIDEDNNITYNVDSIFPDGSTYSPIKLSIYENNYFIRDFDPSADFNEAQAYFSNKTASTSEAISPLEGTELVFVENPTDVNHLSINSLGNINISKQGFILTETVEGEEGEEDDTTVTYAPPGIRLKLDPQFWQEKIFDREGEAVLSNSNNFSEYFRGLYFKAQAVNNDGSYLILNTNSTSSNITIYYTTTTVTQDDNGQDVTTEEQENFVINLSGNKINFLENDFNISIPNGDENLGDERLFLKGGEGSIAKVKLFNGDDLNDGDDQTFDNWKNFFVETDTDGTKNIKKLVNEANLVVYVDQDYLSLSGLYGPEREPDRLYIYDLENQVPLTDFYIDVTNNSLPYFSKYNHLGPLQREGDESNGDGIKYKFRITEHINNLLLNDSTNVELGISVSLNVNLEELVQQQVQTTDGSELTTPISSVLSPRGTVLHGNNTADESKRVYLEIYYTCLEGDCEDEE